MEKTGKSVLIVATCGPELPPAHPGAVPVRAARRQGLAADLVLSF